MPSRDYACHHGSLHLVKPWLGRRSDLGLHQGQWAIGQRLIGIEGIDLQSRDDMVRAPHCRRTPAMPGR